MSDTKPTIDKHNALLASLDDRERQLFANYANEALNEFARETALRELAETPRGLAFIEAHYALSKALNPPNASKH